jgi:hypothetical protein
VIPDFAELRGARHSWRTFAQALGLRSQPNRPPDFAPSSETPDVAPSSKLRKAMSGKPGGYVGQDFGELSRAAVREGFGSNEVLKCDCKTDFRVVGKCWEEDPFSRTRTTTKDEDEKCLNLRINASGDIRSENYLLLGGRFE